MSRWFSSRRAGRARRSELERKALRRAKARLDTLDLYPVPVDVRRVRIVHAPWWFRLPLLRDFDGYSVLDLILVREPLDRVDDDLICHELTHVWQQQGGRWPRMWLSYCRPRVFTGDRSGYYGNRYEIEARRAVALTNESAPARAGSSGAVVRFGDRVRPRS